MAVPTSSPAHAPHTGARGASDAERDELRAIRLAFSAAAKPNCLLPPREFQDATARAELRRSVLAYTTMRRAKGAGPEQVLVCIKAATWVYPVEANHPVVVAALRLVLNTFLLGYYGEADVTAIAPQFHLSRALER